MSNTQPHTPLQIATGAHLQSWKKLLGEKATAANQQNSKHSSRTAQVQVDGSNRSVLRGGTACPTHVHSSANPGTHPASSTISSLSQQQQQQEVQREREREEEAWVLVHYGGQSNNAGTEAWKIRHYDLPPIQFPHVTQRETKALVGLERCRHSRNLIRFFESTTPRFPLHTQQAWNPSKRYHYELRDLWKFFDQPYGHECPVMIDRTLGDAFFVPYLSAIQLYRPQHSNKRNNQHGHNGSKNSLLYFQYFEREGPSGRIPLVDKIELLSRYCPLLLEGKNTELDLER